MLTFLCKLFIAADSSGSVIVDSLRDMPETWTWDDFYVVHTSRIAVWHANAAYGLSVRIDHDSHTRCGSEWKPSWAERHLINRELKRWRARAKQRARRAVKTKLEEALK